MASFREFLVLGLVINVHSRDTFIYIIDVRKTMLFFFLDSPRLKQYKLTEVYLAVAGGECLV